MTMRRAITTTTTTTTTQSYQYHPSPRMGCAIITYSGSTKNHPHRHCRSIGSFQQQQQPSMVLHHRRHYRYDSDHPYHRCRMMSHTPDTIQAPKRNTAITTTTTATTTTATTTRTSILSIITNMFQTSEQTKQENQSHYRIMKSLGQHLWPTTSSSSNSTFPTNEQPDPQQQRENTMLKQRVLLSIGLMVGAKGITIMVPFVFKHLVDSIPTTTHHAIQHVMDATTTTTISDPTTNVAVEMATMTNHHLGMMIPIGLVLGYGISRATAVALQELRNTIFHTVVQDATRNIASQVLYHTLHHLDVQYHLSKSTGQLSRIMEHGLRSIVTILNSMVFHIVPTFIEVSLVTGIMYYQFGISHAAVVMATVIGYTAFTFIITSWRTKFRRDMNRLGAQANGRTVDSFLNYETIQYFNNVQHELQRYNTTMKEYNASSQLAQQSLSLLNVGQSTIFSGGLTAIMYLTYYQILNDQASIGDLVLANGLLFQVSVRTYTHTF